jgi:hypothetical protein
VAAPARRSPARPIAGVAPWKWALLLLGIVLLVVALIAGGGSSSAAVAKIDGVPITQSTYNRWLVASAVSAHSSDKSVPGFPPDAPGYSRCIAFERTAAKTAKAKVPSTASLRTDCAKYRVSLAESVMQFLIGGEWFVKQGAREQVTVSATQVQSAMKTSFPKNSGGLVHYLNSSGLSRADLKFEAESYLISRKLYDMHSGPTPTITQAAIQSYYTQNKSEIGSETLAAATPDIKEILISEKQAPTLDAYLETVQRYWQPLTTCARGYRIADYCHAT